MIVGQHKITETYGDWLIDLILEFWLRTNSPGFQEEYKSMCQYMWNCTTPVCAYGDGISSTTAVQISSGIAQY